MSEDVGVKAPVTRLRRRLSIETEDVKSPAGTITPTKKKGGRLATKPQLDLIEEIDSGQVPKRSTRKTAVKDIEPVEEKPMTPSRRSARIRSNTSIISETPQALDSPRAKRAAARRTSQAGSDNDAPITPARVTRRTRKDSTSSIDKPADKASSKTSAPAEIIVEEQETNTYETDSKDKSINPSPISRGKRGKKNNSSKSSNDTEDDIDNKHLDTSTNKENQVKHEESIKSMHKKPTDNSENKDIHKDYDNKDERNEILTENLDAKPKNNRSILHKSASAIEDFKSKRHRTISVSAIPTLNTNDCSFFSDTEISKKRRKNKSLTSGSSVTMFVQDGEISKKSNDSLLTPLQNINKKDDSLNTSVNSKKFIEIENDNEMKSMNTSGNLNINEETTEHDKSTNSVLKTGWKKNIINQIQTGSKLDSKNKKDYISPIKCFENAPSKNIQSVVILDDDSDSNAVTNDNIRPVPYLDSEDQCVPVVKHDNQTDSNEAIPHNNSYEPMDIDESIQQNTSINKSVKTTPIALNKLRTKKQSLITMDQNDDSSPNKSKRKSLLSSFESHNEKSTCESKSTLILSQIKDTSSNEIEKKLPKANNKEELSKSINIPDKIKNKEVEKRKLSLDYSTSTPLQQKSMKKLGVPIDTSLISPKNDVTDGKKRKSKESFYDSKKQTNTDNDVDSDQSDESGAEITKTQNEIIDDEAEEASEDYESGDSQDSDDRQYEEENRIVEKGETLDTEEEFSDDTDYEKDSFVVSSDAEDNELLSGSGDDLSMSDNELSMSTKSKKKYNEKKIKEQKKASKEMYEARHKLDNSNKRMPKLKTKKNNRQRLDSSSSESGEEISFKKKKNNRQRIDSSQDLTGINSDANESLTENGETKQKRRRKQLSESACDENDLNEQEITICNENKIEEKDPISVTIKHEPKTPQKDNNLSAVVINQNIEEINVVQNVTILKPNETSDPLQATALEIDENSSSSEENKEIMDNYNSVLEGLNNKPKGNKILNNSLNIDKKQKKIKEACVLIEQLNLTQIKSKTIKKKSIEKESLETETHTERENKTPVEKEDDDASDSINMRLLFTEDSNDSENPNTDSIKEVSVTNISEDKDFIPLKKTEAKTNLLEDMDTASILDNSSQLNESKKLKNNQRSSLKIPEENSPSNGTEKNEVSFFIDTTGTRDDQDEPMNVSLSASSKKKKKRNSSLTDVQEFSIIADGATGEKTPKKSVDTEVVITDEVENESEKITPQSEKKKKKGKKSLNITEVDELQNEISHDEPTDQIKTPQSGKKKNKSIWSLDESENIMHNVQEEKEQEISFENKASNDKKKKKANTSLTDTQNEQVDGISEAPTGEEEQEMSFNIFTSSDKKKKKKKKSLNNTQNEQVNETSAVPTEETPQETSFDILTASDKKKAKKSLTNIQSEQIDETSEVPTEQIPQETSFDIITASGKKKKKDKKSLTNVQNEQVDEITAEPIEENPQETSFDVKVSSDKKKKAKKSLTNIQNDETNEINIEDKEQEISFEGQTGSEKKKKKAKKSLDNIQNEHVVETSDEPTEVMQQTKKKRKSSQSNIGTNEIIPLEANKSDDEGAPLEISYQSNKKHKNVLQSQLSEPNIDNKEIGSKKRKRKHSATADEDATVENIKEKPTNELLNESATGRQNKKRKINNNSQDLSSQDKDATKHGKELSNLENSKPAKVKKTKHAKQENNQIIDKDTESTKQNKKRKERDDDDITNVSKVLKQSSFDKAQVPRLPSHILNQLEDKPNKTIEEAKKAKVIATTKFTVENAKVRRNKPSNYLEESVYLNDDTLVEKKQKRSIKKPKVLPFIPTASTSDKGFTTNFRINVLPTETQFVAQATNVTNFKKDFLQQQKMKKFHTFEKYKNQRNVKLSKF
ncbi:hypothetical protein O3G_MSEX005207 [Manduca sexta]|uniref:Protein slender lobes n=2 Tax=Manduca sexta TaxID=7130 RepID=A0A921YYB5_MANSE|nr:hypothetical protein O3G_MSEX005207 [Manduca sexta]